MQTKLLMLLGKKNQLVIKPLLIWIDSLEFESPWFFSSLILLLIVSIFLTNNKQSVAMDYLREIFWYQLTGIMKDAKDFTL